MSRKEGQKRKLLVLLEILARETDEKHPLSVPQLVEKLQEHGVVAERAGDHAAIQQPHAAFADECDFIDAHWMQPFLWARRQRAERSAFAALISKPQHSADSR